MNASTPWAAGRFDTRGGPRKVLFGQMYEDVGIERAAFAPRARVFCVASIDLGTERESEWRPWP